MPREEQYAAGKIVGIYAGEEQDDRRRGTRRLQATYYKYRRRLNKYRRRLNKINKRLIR